jgi:CarD family transcriptional regulator
MIPADNITSVGLRRIINSDNIPKVYEILKLKNVEIGNCPWNRRYKLYMEKIKSGSLFDVAEVLRDLSLLKEDKELSFGERKIMDLAYTLLVKEIAIASNLSQEVIERDIKNIFNW